MNEKSRLVSSIVALAGFLVSQPAMAKLYRPAGGSEVTFHAKITGSSFDAKTKEVGGQVDYDEATGTVKSGTITVRGDTLDTGISKRNKDMREKYLETGKYPELKLQIQNARVPLQPGAVVFVPATMTIKQTTKPVTLKVTLGGAPDAPTVTSKFYLKITDFGIAQPRFAVVSMDPLVQINVSLKFQQAQ